MTKMVFGALQKSANLVDLEKLLQILVQNEYLFAKFGIDTSENEPSKMCHLLICASPDFVLRRS